MINPKPATVQEILNKHSIDGYAECGDGWAELCDRLFADLIALNWDKDLHQLKEKLGLLRCYIGEESDAMTDRIQRAEAESAVTCELCGNPGKLRKKRYWLMTRCDYCWDLEA